MWGEGTMGAPVACHGYLKPRSSSMAVLGATPGSNAPVGATTAGGVKGPLIVKVALDAEAPAKKMEPEVKGWTSTVAIEAETPLKVRRPIDPLGSTTAALADAPLKAKRPVEAERSKVAALAEAPAKELPKPTDVALKSAAEAETPLIVIAPEPRSEKVDVEADEPARPALSEGAKLAVEALEPQIPIPPPMGTMALEALEPEKAMLALKPKEALLADEPVKASNPVAAKGNTAALAEEPEKAPDTRLLGLLVLRRNC